jgi:hypothetical protein
VLVAILQHISDLDDPYGIVARMNELVEPGSGASTAVAARIGRGSGQSYGHVVRDRVQELMRFVKA